MVTKTMGVLEWEIERGGRASVVLPGRVAASQVAQLNREVCRIFGWGILIVIACLCNTIRKQRWKASKGSALFNRNIVACKMQTTSKTIRWDDDVRLFRTIESPSFWDGWRGWKWCGETSGDHHCEKRVGCGERFRITVFCALAWRGGLDRGLRQALD